MVKSGAELVEVGTTNRTHLRDYARALEAHRDAGAVLRVHPSNFRIGGFTARPDAAELAQLAHRHRVPLIEDLGSGALVDLRPLGVEHEPTAAEALRAGSDVVTFSGDVATRWRARCGSTSWRSRHSRRRCRCTPTPRGRSRPCRGWRCCAWGRANSVRAPCASR